MMQSQAAAAIRARLRRASGGKDSQKFREEVARKSGVSARTIGSMMSETSQGNFRLENIEAVASALRLPITEFLTHPDHALHEQRSPYNGGKVALFAQTPDETTKEIVEMLTATDAVGRKMALAAVKVALSNHIPIRKPQTSSN